MSEKTIKLKVIKGSPELINKVLLLIPKREGLYYCVNNNIEIVDSWEELPIIEAESKISTNCIFYDMHLLSTSFGDELKFIDEVKYFDK